LASRQLAAPDTGATSETTRPRLTRATRVEFNSVWFSGFIKLSASVPCIRTSSPILNSTGGRREFDMSDQADRLRQLVGASRAAAVAQTEDEPAAGARESPRTARSLLFTSGKGGVGTSNLVLNLAIALGELGRRALVIDADIGLANLDLLCGLAPRYDLGDVLAGRCALGGAVMTGPGGMRIVRGAHAIRTGAEILEDGPARLVEELGELESESDFVLVDAGSGLGPGATKLAAAADSAVIVTTPEPTSLADAHAAIGRFRRLTAPPPLPVVVGQAPTSAHASQG